MRTLVTDAPRLDMSELKKRGLFESSTPSEIVVRSKASEFFVQRLADEAALMVRFMGETGSGEKKVNVISTQLKYGERPYFECPESHERVLQLYAFGGKLASSRTHGLVHPSRVAKKALAQSDRYADFRLAADNMYSTENALARGGLSEIVPANEIDTLFEVHDNLVYKNPARYKEVANKACNYFLPQINIITLEERGLLDCKAVRRVHLCYRVGHFDLEMVRIEAVFDLRTRENAKMRFEIARQNGERTYGRIELEKVANRWMFACPFERELTYTLHLREGMLASAKGLGVRKSALKTGPWIGQPRGL